jgi:hypothetical protein
MLYFPQLLSGATAQYPFVKRRIQRTAVSSAPDGRTLKLLDPGWTLVEWELTLGTLSSQERAELETFFSTVEGRLGEFTFLDPTDNLFVRSEELTAAAWSKGPFIEFTEGAADPNGGTSATRIFNAGAASQRIQQALEGPGWFHYCFSLYARSDMPGSLTVFRTTAGGEETATYPISSSWKRLAHSGRSQGAEAGVAFGISLEAGASVEVFGMQAEAQPAPSTYRMTTFRNGLYENARFDDDSLRLVSEGPEQHYCTVRIVAYVAS